MWKIGNVVIKNRVVLAPMAGISNPAYMKICEEMGVGYAITELISAEAIVRDNKKTFDMLKGIETLQIPVAVQIFGSNAKTMAKASKIITDLYKNILIDINMGCPVPKVALKSQAGSALLKDLNKIHEIVSSVVASVNVPVTVKIRSGWDYEHINALEVSKVCVEAGAKAICIHPRTRSQGYSGFADWSIIKQIKEKINIPVIGNGDIKTKEDAKRMIIETNCDAVMIGRGALGNPWLIKQINSYLEDNISLKMPSEVERIAMCLKHFNYLQKIKNEAIAILEIRNHIGWYLKGIKGSAELKKIIFQAKKKDDIIELLTNFKEAIK